ncbi:MAG TPA: hypothetical protein VK780_11285 [Thermoanaerobaculia bacterium]|jgi:hypothetical protein|nr:hypothetical protein [Thermoanaerobaculia bacterium]
MSLIDDALKRAQAAQEAGRQNGRPWTPPPLPDSRAVRSRGRRAAAWTGAVLLLAAAVLLWRARNSAKPALLSAPAKAPSAAAATLPPITSEVAVGPPSKGLPPEAIPSSRGETSARSASKPLERPRATPAAGPAAAAPSTGTRESRPHSAANAQERSYPGEMPLAGGGKITLDGIVFSEASPVAVLNGRVLPVGGFVEGYTVVKILPDRVELEADGAKVLLTLR